MTVVYYVNNTSKHWWRIKGKHCVNCNEELLEEAFGKRVQRHGKKPGYTRYYCFPCLETVIPSYEIRTNSKVLLFTNRSRIKFPKKITGAKEWTLT